MYPSQQTAVVIFGPFLMSLLDQRDQQLVATTVRYQNPQSAAREQIFIDSWHIRDSFQHFLEHTSVLYLQPQVLVEFSSNEIFRR